jgi:hypothetical protein
MMTPTHDPVKPDVNPSQIPSRVAIVTGGSRRLGRAMAILVIALVLLEGCYTYKLSEFFRPDGPGTTVRDSDSVPRIQEINLAPALTVWLQAFRQDTTLHADLRLSVHHGHRARFETPVLGFQCGGDAIQWIAIPPGSEGGARDGVGFSSPSASDREFPGAGYERHIPKRGVIPYGDYRFVVPLPACNSPSFSIRLPPTYADDALQPIDPVTFHADRGRFVHVIPIA